MFLIDIGNGEGSRHFMMDQVCATPLQAELGTVEEWIIENWTTDLRTFHMHVNPFQVDPLLMSPKLGTKALYQDNNAFPLGKSAMNPTNPTRRRSRA